MSDDSRHIAPPTSEMLIQQWHDAQATLSSAVYGLQNEAIENAEGDCHAAGDALRDRVTVLEANLAYLEAKIAYTGGCLRGAWPDAMAGLAKKHREAIEREEFKTWKRSTRNRPVRHVDE